MATSKAQQVRIVTNGPSDGANNLINKLGELGVMATKVNNSKQPTKKLITKPTIKWGCFDIATHVKGAIDVNNFLNGMASDTVLNKLTCLDTLSKKKVPAVAFTTDRAVVRQWLQSGERVYVRRVLRGSAGEGIEVLEGENAEIPTAPLYTLGVKGKRREYRIHVYNKDGVKRFWIQQKLRRQGFQENDKYDNTVRNLDHGWIFAHNDITPPKESTVGAAVAAVEAFGLDFGAVDLIERDKGGEPFVLEINTAPGLEGSTVDFYASCIKETLNAKQN